MARNKCNLLLRNPFQQQTFNLNFGSGIQLTELHLHFNLKC